MEQEEAEHPAHFLFATLSPSSSMRVFPRQSGQRKVLSFSGRRNSLPQEAQRNKRSFFITVTSLRRKGPVYWLPIVATMTAFMVCMRFSASSKTFEKGASKTSSVTSHPFTAGRQCRNMASGFPAAFMSSMFTW